MDAARPTAMLLLLCLLLAGCGQRGPLYLPEAPPPAPVPASGAN